MDKYCAPILPRAILAVILIVIGVIFYSYGLHLVAKALWIIFAVCFIRFCWMLRPWYRPRCLECGARMKSVEDPFGGAEIKIFYVCHACEIKAYSQITLIP